MNEIRIRGCEWTVKPLSLFPKGLHFSLFFISFIEWLLFFLILLVFIFIWFFLLLFFLFPRDFFYFSLSFFLSLLIFSPLIRLDLFYLSFQLYISFFFPSISSFFKLLFGILGKFPIPHELIKNKLFINCAFFDTLNDFLTPTFLKTKKKNVYCMSRKMTPPPIIKSTLLY